MTTKRLVECLLKPMWKECAESLIPPWCEGVQEEEAKAKDAWSNVQRLKKQHDELIVIFPLKKEMLDRDFNSAVLKEAGSVHEMLWNLTP